MTKASKAKSATKSAAKPAKEKVALTVDQKLAKLYRSLHDQLENSFLDNALKTCDRILVLAPTDELARQTKVQVLIALEQYPAALALIAQRADPTAPASLEYLYCLYKTGHVVEAGKAVAELEEEAKEDRAVQLLEAQVKYRLEDYPASRDIYEELLATAEPDSPEVPDLQTNLAAATSHLDFLSSVPSLLSTSAIPSLDRLESTPVAPLIHSHAFFKSAPVASTSALPSKPMKTASKKKAGTKDPSQLDPNRWIPKRERPEFADEIVRKREIQRGKNKQALLTQGSAAVEPAVTPAKGSSGGGGNKKKKGKR